MLATARTHLKPLLLFSAVAAAAKICVGSVSNMGHPKTREKTRTRKFGSGSGRVSLNKISGFSGQTLENPKNSGWVSDFSGFLDTLDANLDIFPPKSNLMKLRKFRKR
jgi:hypothetical protein